MLMIDSTSARSFWLLLSSSAASISSWSLCSRFFGASTLGGDEDLEVLGVEVSVGADVDGIGLVRSRGG